MRVVMCMSYDSQTKVLPQSSLNSAWLHYYYLSQIISVMCSATEQCDFISTNVLFTL